jgi:predicted ATPase/serine/threonine protein kinase
MGTDRERIRRIFERALDCASGERGAFLGEACGDDAALRREVEALLAANDRPGGFRTVPAAHATAISPPIPAASAAAASPVEGTVVDDKYRIEGLLGSGGMGTVYRARHVQLERPVALKVLRSELLAEPSMAERFRREAVAVARLRHPNIVTVHDYGLAPGIGAYLVLELLEGRLLRDELTEHRRLDTPTTLAILGQVCAAVEAAHRAGVVHRDLKPDNVFLERRATGRGSEANAPLAKVLDFGLAKLEEVFRSSQGRLTLANAVVGTPLYMSPEQCQGEDVDARSDVYALGCMAYEMLTGRPPFTAPSVAALVYKHIDEAPARPSRLAPEIAPAVEEALLRALAKRPTDRHPSAESFARALGAPSGFDRLSAARSADDEADPSTRVTALIEGAQTGYLRPNNLPQALTRFVGRRQEIAEVQDWLARERLVTLVGPGGIGKTRLALEVAARVVDEYRDGVWLVALASLADPESVPQAIASTLGVREHGTRSILEALVAWLKERSLVIVLDNCEHLVEACARVTHTLLEASAGLRVLATSRETLSVTGEVSWQVPALAFPAPDASDALECESVRLFVDRATLAKPSFAGEQAASAVAALCRRLEGIPLAIELAAARAKALSVEQILERLDDRFRLLSGGSRTAPTRQQALRATLDWSYDLLTEEESALLRHLGVFSGGWSLEAAEAICPPSAAEATDVLDLLIRLVDKSLVVHDLGAERFGMLETIREYALERLWTAGEGGEALRRHAAFFLLLGEAAGPETQDTRRTEWFERLETEHDNLRTALEWLLEHDAEGCLRLASALRNLWLLHGHLREGRQWLDLALERCPSAPASVRRAALQGNGDLALQQGDLDAARACFEEIARIAEAEGDVRHIMLATNSLALMHYRQGDVETARALFEKNLANDGCTEHSLLLAATLNSLGEIARFEGSWADAQRLYERAVALWRREGDHYGLSIALANLGAVVVEQGDAQRASACYREALTLSRDLGDMVDVSLALDGLAAVTLEQESPGRAARLAGAADGLREAIGYELEPTDEAFRARYLALLRARAGDAGVDAAMAEGRAMTPDQAIDFALRG